MINPYEKTNWNSDAQIISVSHAHTSMDSLYTPEQQQLMFQRVVNGGVRHFALSNYYPSQPRYPLSDYYTDIPQNAISCPNAEQHNFATYGNLHINSLGSFYETGSTRNYVDGHWEYNTPIGVNKETWESVFPKIFSTLQYSDGGGITINHPVWSSLTDFVVLNMLDFDERVLGIEIFNHSCEIINQTGWALDWWDKILLTGRKCWGFCVPDHTAEQGTVPWLGRNVLLVPEISEHECLKAYRNGAFYSRLGNTNLKFSNISLLENGTLNVETENATTIDVIIDEQKTSYSGNSVEVTIPSSAIYVRIEANSSEDRIFSNPIIFKEKKGERKNGNTTMFLLMS